MEWCIFLLISYIHGRIDTLNSSHKVLFEKVWLKNKSYIFNRLVIEKNTSMKEILEREIEFSKVECYSSLTPLHHDQIRKVLSHLKSKMINGELSREIFNSLYHTKMFADLLKAFGKKKSIKSFFKEVLKVLNSILKRYLLKVKNGERKRKRIDGKLLDISNYKLVDSINISNLIK